MPFKDIPSIQSLADAGAAVVNSREPRLVLEDLFYLSGEIPRVTPYERGMPGHMKKSLDGSGWEPDPMILDERYVAVSVRGKGIIVFTACSHAGVINVLKDASDVFKGMPLYGVMGGFHLSGPGPEASNLPRRFFIVASDVVVDLLNPVFCLFRPLYFRH